MPSARHIVVPPQSGRALRVAKGEQIRIVDPKGQQVADLWAFVTGDVDLGDRSSVLEEHLRP